MVEIASYGPWAVITGASSGIGEAFAGQLAAAGLNLVLSARSTSKLEALGQALAGSHGISYRVVTVDLGDPAGRETITAFLKHRPLHIPGRLMRIMTRLMPRSLSVRMNGRMLGQAARTVAQRQVAPAE